MHEANKKNKKNNIYKLLREEVITLARYNFYANALLSEQISKSQAPYMYQHSCLFHRYGLTGQYKRFAN